jgi:ribosomal protein L37E
MEVLKTYIKCGRCGGRGIAYTTSNLTSDIPEDPCNQCGGTGFHVTGKVDGAEELDWIKNKIKKILKKLDLEED